MEKSKRLSRQSSSTASRRGNCIISVLTSSACRFLMGVGAIFFIGILSGVYLDGYFMWNTTKLYLAQRPARAFAMKAKQVPKEKGRPGLSIKKDLSIQFRDYLPRHIFVDTSLGPPRSLELFRETYPEAYKYKLYAFLADSSYADLYAKFPNISLYVGIVPSTSKNKTTMVLPAASLAKKANRSVPINMINFSAWLKENVHPDEYVVVKLTTNPQNEEQIVKQLVRTGALEWVDKFYTTTSDDGVIEIATERFSSRGNEVLMWDDERFTYSDFDEVNPPRVKTEEGEKLNGCPVKNETGFALLLFASILNINTRATIELLGKAKKQSSKLPLTLFLPLDSLDALCGEMLSLSKCVNIGLYLQDSFFSDLTSDDAEMPHNRIRNKFVSAEHCFAQGNQTLTYTLFKSEMLKSESLRSGRRDKTMPEDNKAVKELISERKYTIISNVHDVTPLVRAGKIGTPQELKWESRNESLIAFDISTFSADAFVLQLLNTPNANLIPLHACSK